MLETSTISEFDKMAPEELGNSLAKIEEHAIGKDPHYIKLNEARELARRYPNEVRSYLKNENKISRTDLINLRDALYSNRERSKLMGGYEDLGVREFSDEEMEKLRLESQKLRNQR